MLQRRGHAAAECRYELEIRNADADIDDHCVHLRCTARYMVSKTSKRWVGKADIEQGRNRPNPVLALKR